MSNEEARRLLDNYRKGRCTEEEKRLLENWYKQWNQDGQLSLSEEDLSDAERDMWGHLQELKSRPKNGFAIYKLAIAAMVLIGISFSINGYYSERNRSIAYRLEANDVAPGQDKAVLTLSNGQRFELDGLGDHTVIEANGLRIKKDGTGQLICEVIEGSGEDKVSLGYNEISTPRGGHYKVVLPDGTKVWLNAASSLKYPVSFAANERRVSLTGEAYFEVAKKLKDQTLPTGRQRLKTKEERLPFLVETFTQTVEVLGTHFNINDYGDENTAKTTLVEGSVMVYANRNDQKMLVPGQQSVINKANRKIQANQVQVEEFIAWKEGNFFFNGTDLKDVMRQLERWYDVEVVDIEKFPDNNYNGKLPKDVKLSKILQVLELTSDLKFKIQGERRISLMN